MAHTRAQRYKEREKADLPEICPVDEPLREFFTLIGQKPFKDKVVDMKALARLPPPSPVFASTCRYIAWACYLYHARRGRVSAADSLMKATQPFLAAETSYRQQVSALSEDETVAEIIRVAQEEAGFPEGMAEGLERRLGVPRAEQR